MVGGRDSTTRPLTAVLCLQSMKWCDEGIYLLASQPVDKCQSQDGAEAALQEIEKFLETGVEYRIQELSEIHKEYGAILSPDLLVTQPVPAPGVGREPSAGRWKKRPGHDQWMRVRPPCSAVLSAEVAPVPPAQAGSHVPSRPGAGCALDEVAAAGAPAVPQSLPCSPPSATRRHSLRPPGLALRAREKATGPGQSPSCPPQ